MGNKRHGRRVPLDVYVNKYLKGVPYLARAADISADGISLERLIEPRHPDKRVGVQFQLPDSDEVIFAEGEVVREWGEDAQEGSSVRFTLITDRHRKLIQQFVAQRAQ